MEFLTEIVFRWLIVRIIGIYTRYYFFKFIGNKKEMDQLNGDKSSKNDANFSQDFYNALVGLLVFCSISVGIACLVFSNW